MGRRLYSFYTKTTERLSGRGMGKLPGVKALHQLFQKVVEPTGIACVPVQGSTMYVDMGDRGLARSLALHGVYEAYETELFKTLLRPGDTVVDAGANIGYYTLLAARLVGTNGRVYAFEPEPANMALLVRNIRANGYENVTAVQKALSDAHGNMTLFTDRRNFAAATLSEGNIPLETSGSVRVETVPLDAFLDSVSMRDVQLIKMDTQGSEGLILGGADRTLRDNQVKIITEFWPYGLRNLGTDPAALLRRLKEYGFRTKVIDESEHRLVDMDAEAIVRKCESEKNGKGFVNLFLQRA